jgi:type I restriction enzyme S subunit
VSEQNGELPHGWIRAKLGDVLEFKYGKSLPAKQREGFRYPVFGSNGIIGQHSEALVGGPVLIIGRKGSIGEVHQSDGPCSPIDTTYFVDNFCSQPIRFWYYRLKALPLAELNRATALPGLNRQDAYDLEIALPPLAEQRRIVAKIEALQERSRRAREALAEVGPLLEQFQQSVLAGAFCGDLTADWRAAHPNIESASEFLHRIYTERRRRWEEAELAKYEAKSQRPPNNWKDRYKEPKPVDDSELPELPEGWCWTTLGALTLIDSGEAFKKKDYGTSGLRLFQIANVGFGKTVWQQRNYLPEHFTESHGFLLLENTDIVMALNRPILDGRLKVTRITDDDLPAILYQRIGRLRTAVSGIVDYLFAFMRSPLMLQQVESNLQGTDQPYINTSDLPDIIVPLAPLAEQTAILTIVNRSFDAEGTVEDQHSAALMELDQLDQSILAKAFRGELVPQDPNDEPASALLARIREQRMQQIEAAKHKQKTATLQRRNQRNEEVSRPTP